MTQTKKTPAGTRTAVHAKAGNRKAPAKKGPHITSEQDRAYGRYLAKLGLPTTILRKDHSGPKAEQERKNQLATIYLLMTRMPHNTKGGDEAK